MGQINMHMTPGFKKNLDRFMRVRGIKTKSAAIRVAVEEALRIATRKTPTADFREWLGLGNQAPLNRKPRFATDADLWG